MPVGPLLQWLSRDSKTRKCRLLSRRTTPITISRVVSGTASVVCPEFVPSVAAIERDRVVLSTQPRARSQPTIEIKWGLQVPATRS